MKVLVLLEAVFERTPDGRIWSSGVYTTSFFLRYLTVFSHLVIAARLREVANAGDHEITDARISFHPIPAYHGLVGYLRQRKSVCRSLKEALIHAEALILRVPSPIAGRAQRWLINTKHPFGLEVVGDPWEVFSPGAIRHPLRPLLRQLMTRELRRQCQAASAASYVTAHALQQRYPVAPGIPTFSYSSIELRDDWFSPSSRVARPASKNLRLISVGVMHQRYKGHDVLLRAIAASRDPGSITLVLVGDGVERRILEQQARDLGLAANVRFTGHLSNPAAIRAELDLADAFVLASRQEGLPRAMIEAMARGLPCLGTTIGGIPELLNTDAMVPPDNCHALASLIDDRLRNSTWMSQASARNLSIAQTYHDDELRIRREMFYRTVQAATADWLEKR